MNGIRLYMGGWQLTYLFLLLDQSLVQLQTVRTHSSTRHLHRVVDANVEPVLRPEEQTYHTSSRLLGSSSRGYSGVVV